MKISPWKANRPMILGTVATLAVVGSIGVHRLSPKIKPESPPTSAVPTVASGGEKPVFRPRPVSPQGTPQVLPAAKPPVAPTDTKPRGVAVAPAPRNNSNAETPSVVVIDLAKPPALQWNGRGAWAGGAYSGPSKEWPWSSHPDVATAETEQRRHLELQTSFEQNRKLALELAAIKGWELRIPLLDGATAELTGVDAAGLPKYKAPTNADAAISTAVTLVQNVNPYASGGALTGSGFRVGVWDEARARTDHRELTGRVIIRDGTASNSNHATHVAGTIGASGVTATAKGMLPAVGIDSYDWTNDETEMNAAGATSSTLTGTKLAISNHSYGYISGWNLNVSPPRYHGRYPAREDEQFGQYTSDAQTIDRVAFDRPFYLIFKSAGNDRSHAAPSPGTTFQYYNSNNILVSKTYVSGVDPLSDGWDNGGFDTIGGGFGSAKNIITVGAANDAVSGGQRLPSAATISSFSGWGPVDDGRIKPDLVANGVGLYSPTAGSTSAYSSYNGTSMSSPNAAGTAMLLQQLYSRQFGGEIMRASALKALLIHSADDIGRPGPDYVYGWGLINAKRAADVILAHRNNPAASTLVEGELTTSRTSSTHTFNWSGSGPIRATIAWTDPAGNTVSGLDNSTRNLVNDLDIRLTGPIAVNPYVLSRTSPANNAGTGDNIVDNVEQIYLAAPAAGAYTLRVSHKGTLSGGRQRYSLVITGQGATTAGPVIALAPASLSATTNQGGASPAAQSFTVRNSGTGTLSYSVSDNATWLSVSPTSGSSTGGTNTHNVTFNTTGMTGGVYNAQVTVQSSTGAVATLPVQLTITTATVTLAAALDVSTTPANYGSLPWRGQTAISNDGVDAGRSGAITHLQESGFSMTLVGPGILSFYAKVDSEATYDFLRFDLDNVQQDSMTGAVDWTAKQFTIPSGTHTFRWRYTKDGSLSNGLDAGFVDRVLYVQSTPEIALQPDREIVATTTQGSNAAPQVLTVRNSGLGTLSYSLTDNVNWLSLSPTTGTSTGESDSINVTFANSTLAAGTYTGTITVTGGTGVVSRTLPVRLVVNPIVSTVTFAQAVDYTTSTWSQSAGSSAPWIGQTQVTHDAIDAGKSGVITHSQSSRVSTTLTGPGTLNYWWKVDSESNWDFLELWIDGGFVRSISGNVNWSQVSSSIGSGSHTVEFRYAKDGSINTGADAGWVDQFVFNGTRPPLPVFAPSSLALRGEEGSSQPMVTGIFDISNSGGGTFNYTITDNATWMSVSPTGDSVTTEADSITVTCNTSGLRAGNYSGQVRVDCGALGVHIIPVSLQVTSSIAVPVNPTPTAAYSQAFASATPPNAAQGWTYYSDNEGSIRVVSGMLRMDDSVAEGAYSLNEAVLHANLLGKGGVTLRFKNREYTDEDDLLPATFTGHANGDGIAISTNGTTWHRIDTLAGANTTLRQTTISLDPIMASLGLTYTSGFQIKFQQYDNYPVASDGIEFDDVSLSVLTTGGDDHGGTTTAATPVILGATANGRIEVPGDVDFFKVVLPSTTTLMAFTTGGTDTIGTIYDAGGNLITSNDDYDLSALGWNFFLSTTLTPGTYYVSVRGWSSSTGAYVLNLHDGGSDTGRPELPADLWDYPDLTDFNPFEADWILYPFEGLVYSFFTPVGSPDEVMTFDGEMSLSFTGSGYTGTLYYRGATYRVHGAFDRDTGTSSVSIPRTGTTPIVLNLEFKQVENSPSLSVVGSIGINGRVAYVELSERLAYAPRAGRYTFVLPADPQADPQVQPGGDGYATMTLGTGGNFTMSGRVADGTPFTESGWVTSDGFFYLYRAIYPGGWIAGDMKFRYLAGVSDVDGLMEWYKPVRPADPYYRDGLDLWVPMLGSSYIPPPTVSNHVLPGLPLGRSGATANFGSGDFFPPLGLHGITLNPSDVVTYSGPAGLTMSINRADGTFTGTIRQPYTNRVFPFRGVTFQRQGIMSGYVTGPNPYYYTTGFISIE